MGRSAFLKTQLILIILVLAILLLPLWAGKLYSQYAHERAVDESLRSNAPFPDLESQNIASPEWSAGIPIAFVYDGDCVAGCISTFNPVLFVADFLLWYLAL